MKKIFGKINSFFQRVGWEIERIFTKRKANPEESTKVETE